MTDKKYYKYYISSLVSMIYIAILLVINCIIKNLNLTYVLFSILVLNWGIKSLYNYKNEKSYINLGEIIGCIIAFLGLCILML